MDTLLISTPFFSYPQDIVKALAGRGRKAMFFADRPAEDTLTKGLVRISPKLVERRSAAYFEDIFRQAAQHEIRDILVIKGEALSVAMIRRMREVFPETRLTLYFWDSYRNMPKDSKDKVDLFDRAFSFDPEDVAADPRLTYRPLFYVDEYAEIGKAEQHDDLLFIGTAHSDRVKVLDRIARALPEGVGFSKRLFARSRLLHRIEKIANPVYRRTPDGDFVFSPIPKDRVKEMVGRARIIVDIERNVQTGYTMRTLEMLGASRKLLTTNPSILKADFYHPNNHCYIDRERPVIDPDFLAAPWTPIEPALLRYYSLSRWLDEVLG